MLFRKIHEIKVEITTLGQIKGVITIKIIQQTIKRLTKIMELFDKQLWKNEYLLQEAIERHEAIAKLL